MYRIASPEVGLMRSRSTVEKQPSSRRRYRPFRAVRALSHSQNSLIEKVYPLLADKAEAFEFVALEGAKYLDTPLSRLRIRKGVLVSMIVRGRQVIIPFGSDHIEAGDTVILTAQAGTVSELKDAFT